MRIDRRTVMAGASALAVGACMPLRTSRRARPNILFIMTDDHAQSALGCYGNPIIKTPNLDRLAAEGIRYNKAFVTNSLCLPSRATYLTGLYSHTHGMRTNGVESQIFGEPLLDNSATYPNLLRQAGYHTGVVGKWHVNTPPSGYDYTAVLPGQGQYFNPQIIVQGRMDRGQGHTDDVIGDQALAFLNAAPRDRPFCLLYQFKAPHRGWEPAPRFARAYEDIDIPPPATFSDDLAKRPEALRKADIMLADMPDYRKRGVTPDLPFAERARRNYEFLVKDYYRVLMGVDENVGRVLDWLDRSGRAEDTLVVYTSDNGFFLGEHGMFDKRLMYEPALRVPMLVRYPAGFQRGHVDDEHMLLNVDMAPTALDIGGADVPASMHGRSWADLAAGRGVRDWRRDFLYEYYEFPAAHCVRPNRGVRTDRWKLIHWLRPEEWELFDLQADPEERTNLYGRPEHAALAERLKRRIEALRRETGDTDPPEMFAREPANLRFCEPLDRR